ncbi:hypothetical protein ES702_01039 [subsurface metagenome]
MKGKKLLTAFYKRKARFIDIALLKAKVNYMMCNPARFLAVNLFYDSTGAHGRAAKLPEDVDTKGKILVMVLDNRGIWSDKSGIPLAVPLLDDFKTELETIHSFIAMWTTDMDTDVVAGFYTQQENLLGYFYQGEYHLWEK